MDEGKAPAQMPRAKSMTDVITSASNLSTFATAVTAGGLVDTLKSPGPFTVFAPNDDSAFAGLPAGTLDNLLKPENKSQLANLLNYHVVPGTYTTDSLKAMAQKGETLKTVQGETLGLVLQDEVLKVKDAKGGIADIETPDAIAGNGVFHVITAVLMPS